ncbi:hypothetical protein [Gaetbulibacter aestuarii]|uniref:Transcription regulator BetR N-terminal domain-containing protein n=1 Tax=Gaetbulibacter aestuarii TaxID=1502358 RepID=A0ABW7MY20_9FLAO
MQEQFFSYLKSKTPDTSSFVDEVAGVLDVGYDAAYRRINLKTTLSIDEAVKLARYYKISLNKLFEVGSEHSILADLSPPLQSIDGINMWMKKSYENLIPLTKIKGCSVIYSAKDIPVFHTLKDNYLSRYKIYVWLKDIEPEITKKKITFDDFIKSIPKDLLDNAFRLGNIYKDINITEIWNNTTINGTLQQVLYYFEAGALSKDLALKICSDIEDVIRDIEKQAIKQSLDASKGQAIYNLYVNHIHNMSNTMMVITPMQKVFFIPFSVISYIKIEHQPTCEMRYDIFKKEMSSSKLLVNAGEKDRSLFFNRIHHKINRLRERIRIDDDAFDFE